MGATTAVAGLVDGHPGGVPGYEASLAVLAAVMSVNAKSSLAQRRMLVDSVLVLGVWLGAAGWIGVVFRVQPWAHPDGNLWRAATTVTYANASAAIFAMLALLAITRSAEDMSAGASVRLLSLRSAATMIILTGLGATLSRAGTAAFAAGLVVLAVLLGRRTVLRTAGPALLGATVAVAACLPGMPATGPEQPQWALPGVAVGLALAAIWPLLRRARRTRPEGRWSALRLVSVVVGAGAVAAAGVAVGVDGHWQTWSGRVGVASPGRSSLFRAALNMFRYHVLAGVGPGRATFIWTGANHQGLVDRFAHDEYLQLAAEQGIIGLAGLLVLALAVVVTAARSWRSSPQMLKGGAIAALVSFSIHSGFDFLWHVPAALLIASMAVGLTVPPCGTEEQQPEPTETGSRRGEIHAY